MATIIQPPHSDARAAFWDTALKISPQSRAMTSPDHLANGKHPGTPEPLHDLLHQVVTVRGENTFNMEEPVVSTKPDDKRSVKRKAIVETKKQHQVGISLYSYER